MNSISDVTDLTFYEKFETYKKELLAGIEARKGYLQESEFSGMDKKDESYTKIEGELKRWEHELTDIDERILEHINLVQTPLVSESDSKRVDIICLKYKEEEIEKQCATALIGNTKWPYRLTWYDTRNQTANFSKLWNYLTVTSTCDYVLIMDSDAFVTESENGCWLTHMMHCFEDGFECRASPESSRLFSAKKVGLVVPVTHKDGAHTIQGRGRGDRVPQGMHGPFFCREQVSGFFFLFKKEMWEEIGPFDERFYLHGQDSEWVDRILESNWEIVVQADSFVDHLVSASISKATKENELDYEADLIYTRSRYDSIKQEKKEDRYVPYTQ